MQESPWTIFLFALFLISALAFVYQAHQGAKPGARLPLSIPIGSETLPAATTLALQARSAGSSVNWTDKRGYLVAELLPGDATDAWSRLVRVIGRNSKNSGFAISYWGIVNVQGSETRLTYFFSPFIFIAYLTFGAALLLTITSSIIIQMVLAAGVIYMLFITLRQARLAVKTGIAQLARVPVTVTTQEN